MSRAIQISTDASCRGAYAGIAGVFRQGKNVRVLFLDVLETGNSGYAERFAMEKAMEFARLRGWSHAIFHTDLEGLKVQCRKLPLWQLHVIPRKQNSAAHSCATQALRLYEAARAGTATVTAADQPSLVGESIIVAHHEHPNYGATGRVLERHGRRAWIVDVGVGSPVRVDSEHIERTERAVLRTR